MAAGAATGCGGAALISSAVIVFDSMGRGGGSLRIVSAIASKPTWIPTTATPAAMTRGLIDELSGGVALNALSGVREEDGISAWLHGREAVRTAKAHAACKTGGLHFRKMSREINSVATKPISSSIVPSLIGGWRAGLM